MKELVVQTENGHLCGIKKTSVEGYEYCAFLGIPYAKPPINDLRFQDPQPPENWSGVRDATKFGEICCQFDTVTRTFRGSEDCLFLNVYTRSIDNSSEKKPVMVFVHGGGFLFGSGNDSHFGPDYLLRKDVILVTFNYRLGIFGFLNLDHEIAPGNQGLKDQVMALKWIQKNIENFGGDPNNVTVFGESAGAAAVHYLILSPMTKGLFHKAICQSGIGFNAWSTWRDSKKYIFQLCGLLGKYFHKPEDTHKYLKSVEYQRIVQAQEQVRRSCERLHHLFPFGPGPDSKSENPLMPIPVEEAALEGVHIPLMLGYNSREGIGHLIDPVSFTGQKKDEFDKADRNFSKMIAPYNMVLLKRYDLTLKDLRRMYYEQNKISQANCDIYADMAGDLNFVEGIHKAVKVQVEKSSTPTYLYKFSYDKDVSMTKLRVPIPLSGACHFDEMEYLFNIGIRETAGLPPHKKGSAGYKIMEQMTEMWTNFAAYGTPTPKTSELLPVEWLPVDNGTNLRYLNIDRNPEMETMMNIEQRFLSAKSERNL